MSDGLNRCQREDAQAIAEIEVRQYFDYYLREIWPQHQEALKQHVEDRVQAHDDDDEAHGGVETRFNRLIWVAIGASVAFGTAGGAGLAKLLPLLVG